MQNGFLDKKKMDREINDTVDRMKERCSTETEALWFALYHYKAARDELANQLDSCLDAISKGTAQYITICILIP